MPETGACSAPEPVVCDDQNPCTEDSCDSETGCLYTNTDAPCDDGSPCTSGDVCSDGECSGEALACDDGDACTLGACDEVSGECVYTDLDCDDEDLCTADLCDPQTGTCSNPESWPEGCVGAPCLDVSCDPVIGCQFDDKVCDDGDACTLDSCDSEQGCVASPLTLEGCEDYACWTAGCSVNDEGLPTCTYEVSAACDDGDACTDDECAELGPDEFECLSTALSPEDYCPPDMPSCTFTQCVDNAGFTQCAMGSDGCNDGIACTLDSCDEESGTCVNTPDDALCDFDENPCTLDTCEPGVQGGCTSAPVDCGGSTCNPMTCVEVNGGAECASGPPPCDDENPCTTDACDPVEGCTHTPNEESCDDGLFCTLSDTCSDGECVGEARVCDDEDPCTTGACDEGAQACVGTPVTCDDGVACTLDSCDPESGCESEPNDEACDDDNLCTTLTCSLEEGCTLSDEVICDGGPCTTGGCDPQTGDCAAVNPIVCDDGIACTDDYCDNLTGDCVFQPNNLNCDDANACTTDECDLGAQGCVNALGDPDTPHLKVTGPPSEGFGAAVWNTSAPNNAEDEPPQTNHSPPYGCGGGPVYQYFASPDYDNAVPGTTGGFYATELGGPTDGPLGQLQTFVNYIESQGYTLADLTFHFTVVNLGDDVEGEDWGLYPPSIEWRHYTNPGATFTFKLGGEAMVGGPLTTVRVLNNYAGCNVLAQTASVSIDGLEPSDVTTDATPAAVRNAAGLFLDAFSLPFLGTSEVNICGFSTLSLTLESFSDSSTGRSGGLFGLDSGVIMGSSGGGLD